MVYRFDAFDLDMDRVELRKEDVPVPVEPQVFALLALLVTNSERMVSKNEINERIWGGRVVSEAVLSSRIKSARQAIGDDGKNQRLIRTVHGQGFRFVGEVTTTSPDTTASVSPGESGEKTTDSTVTRPAIAVLPFFNTIHSSITAPR